MSDNRRHHPEYDIMRVLTYVLTSLLVIVTSFNILSVDNSIDNPRHIRMKKLLDELHQIQTDFENTHGPVSDSSEDDEMDQMRKVPGELALEIAPHGINYFWHQMMASIRHDVLRQSTISFQTSYLGFDVRADAIQIVHFHPPTIHMKSTSDQVQIRTEGGHAKLLGLYSGKYRTIREGQLEATIEDFHVNLDITRSADGRLMAKEEDCVQSLGSVEISLRPILPSQISDTIRDEIITRVARRICPAVVTFTNRILKTTKSSLILQRPVNEITSSNYKFAYTEANDQNVVITYDNESSNLQSALRLPKKASAMSYIAISEKFINDYLNEVSQNGDIIFQLHKIKKVKNALRLDCDSNDLCIGNSVKLPKALEGTGQLEARCVEAPTVTFTSDQAHLQLNLHFELSYKHDENDDQHIYLSFNAPVNLRITDVRMVPMPEGHYRWRANFQVESINIGKIHQKDLKLSNMQKMLEDFIEENMSEIESLLNTHLEGKLPLFSNHNIHIKQHGHARFSRGQMLVQADFKINKALFPVFDFSF